MPGYYSAQLYSYPARRWRKKRRQYLLNDNYTNNNTTTNKESEQNCNESTGSSGVSQEAINTNSTNYTNNNSKIVQNGNCISLSNSNSNSTLNDLIEDSKDSWLRYEEDGSDLPDAGELDDPESDYEDYEEYSSRKKKSKRKEPIKKKRTDYPESQKPFHCELCGIRYKTRPGLIYHYAHSHQDSNGALSSGNGSISEENSFFSSIKGANQSGNNSQQSSASNHSTSQSHCNSLSSQSPITQSNHLPNNSSRTITSEEKDRKGKHFVI